MAQRDAYHIKGILLGACNCDWGCPCNFEAPPTRGFCEGSYLWHMEEGAYAQVRLDQLNFSWCAHSPGPLHLGNVTALYLMDARADAHQRRALEDMLTKNPDVMPFGVFTSLTSTFLGIRYVTFELDLKGIHSRARVPGILDYQLAPKKNLSPARRNRPLCSSPRGLLPNSRSSVPPRHYASLPRGSPLITVVNTASSPASNTQGPNRENMAGAVVLMRLPLSSAKGGGFMRLLDLGNLESWKVPREDGPLTLGQQDDEILVPTITREPRRRE